MTPAKIHSRLRSARTELECVCNLLESPSPVNLDHCAATMQRVIGELGVERMAHADATEARRLRAAVQRVRALLDLAADYHFRWRRILASISGGYTVRGAPAPLASRVRVSIQG